MPIITLTSDFGIKDYSVAAVKGGLLSQINTLTIIDISHSITPYNISEAAFVLKAAYPNFPKDSIHIIGIDAAHSPEHNHIIAKLNGHYFIGADNGIFSLLTEEEQFEKLIRIEHPKSKSTSFPTLDVFVDVAVQIAIKENLEHLGSPTTSINKWVKNKPDIAREDEIIGHIRYIDSYGNIITDISKEFFDEFGKNRTFEISASNAKITTIHPNYDSIINFELSSEKRKKAGSEVALFNSLGFLEIALYKSNPKQGGSAASLLGLCVGGSIRIVFN